MTRPCRQIILRAVGSEQRGDGMPELPTIDAISEVLHQGFEESARSEWIDYNGHMNVAFYVLAFDHATDHFATAVGLDEAYMKARGGSFFALDLNVTYRREVSEGARLRFVTQLLGVGAKKLLFYHYMFAGEEGYLAATCENLSIHVDMETRRSAPFPEDRRAVLMAMHERHASAGRPDNAGRILSI